MKDPVILDQKPDAKVYEHGLKPCEDTPQEYHLGAVLAGYQRGFKTDFQFLMTVSVPDDTVKSDGSWDFTVPGRYAYPWRPWRKFKNLCKNIRLAWAVVKGDASILRYK